MKLWDKGFSVDKLVEEFTVGSDRELDLQLAQFDVLGSIAHVQMLGANGLISEHDCGTIVGGLELIGKEIAKGTFAISPGCEDVHSEIEFRLTERLGEVAGRMHTARSRNDQVLLCMHLWAKSVVDEFKGLTTDLFNLLIDRSDMHRSDPMPGYTHMQIAMPTSFGLWFGGYGELLIDDVLLLNAAGSIADQNPLGSAAGYGSSFRINRTATTEALGFSKMRVNSFSAALSRGKLEWSLSVALSSLAASISRLAADIVLYSGGNFQFFSLPDSFTTGSSIMPHKKNPDVFELIRGKCNLVRSIPHSIDLLMGNLPGGYHREYQLLKEVLFPAVSQLRSSIMVALHAIPVLEVSTDWQADDRYRHLYSVEEVNKLVADGIPFRDAYKSVGERINDGTYSPSNQIEHTHIGSKENLSNEIVRSKFANAVGGR